MSDPRYQQLLDDLRTEIASWLETGRFLNDLNNAQSSMQANVLFRCRGRIEDIIDGQPADSMVP